MASVKVDGLDNLARKLTQLEHAVGGGNLLEASEAGAATILIDAERLAPRRARGHRPRKRVAMEVVSRAGRAAEVAIGATRLGFYLNFQELGTRHHPPQPWLRPAFDARRRDATEAARRVLKAFIARVARA